MVKSVPDAATLMAIGFFKSPKYDVNPQYRINGVLDRWLVEPVVITVVFCTF